MFNLLASKNSLHEDGQRMCMLIMCHHNCFSSVFLQHSCWKWCLVKAAKTEILKLILFILFAIPVWTNGVEFMFSVKIWLKVAHLVTLDLNTCSRECEKENTV